MKTIKKILYRIFQKVMYVACFFLRFPEPKLISGKGSLSSVPKILKENGIGKVLIVTDSFLAGTPLFKSLLNSLLENKIDYVLYDKVKANPDIKEIENGIELATKDGVNSIIAYGGGSPMDAAKIIGARLSNPKRSIEKMKGILRVGKKPHFLMAIPSTAGTGSEATIAAVISNHEAGLKYPIEDPKLIPDYALLDPEILINLPPKMTSTTGVDALSHALEAYLGSSNTKKTKNYALKALKLINENLVPSFEEGNNLEFRSNMSLAAYYAGVSFTRAYVGYVHAIAHALGALYNVPHGLAIAVVMPYVLDHYGNRIAKKMSEISIFLGIGNKNSTSEENAKKYLDKIKADNDFLGIPHGFKDIIKESDISKMISLALAEANPLYPVPVIFFQEDFQEIFNELMKN